MISLRRTPVGWILLLGAIAGCGSCRPSETAPPPAPPEQPAQTHVRPGADGLLGLTFGDQSIRVEIADTAESRALGLMHRDALPWNRGMIFIYPKEATLQFWMKNTRIPLSIAFIRSSGEIVEIQDMEPMTEDSHYSSRPARFALEMNRGWFDAKGIGVGTVVTGLPGGGGG